MRNEKIFQPLGKSSNCYGEGVEKNKAIIPDAETSPLPFHNLAVAEAQQWDQQDGTGEMTADTVFGVRVLRCDGVL